MKKLLLLILIPLSLVCHAQNADTLLYERFETGGTSFTLNSSDEGGVSSAVGYNQWIVNNAYNGGSGQLVCLGFPFNFTIPNTPAQPAAQTGSANSGYMHIVSDAGQAVGVQNCCYLAADGICNFNENNFTRMSQDVSTTVYDSVTVSFLWICAGGTNIYGEFYYSINSGTSWNLVTTPISQYRNQSNWVAQSITIPAFAGQSTLRFGYRFVNQSSTAANEPGFGIDEFMITGKNAAPPPVAAFNVSDAELCVSGCVDFMDQSTGSPSTWLWIFQGATTGFSTQQNPAQICYTTPGTYDVTLIVTNASGTDTLTTTTVVVHPAPSVPTIALSGDTLYATPGYQSYQWLLNGIDIPGANSDFHVVLTDGAYMVLVTDTNGCEAVSDTLSFTTGLMELSENAAAVFPNPVNDELNIIYTEGIVGLVIFDYAGRIVASYVESPLPEIISMKNFANGIYTLMFHSEKGGSAVQKVAKM